MYTATTTNESESVCANSKIQLDLIRREVDNLSIFSNENNESIYDDLRPHLPVERVPSFYTDI
jgi:hypothetical protein